MILTLRGKNFLTFPEFYMEFSTGMNAITGESGAGKTVLLRALKVITGKAIDQNVEPGSFVEATFLGDETVFARASELGLDFDGEEFLVRVDFHPQKTLYRLNGHIIPRQLVKELLDGHIEIHSQHGSVKLLDPSRHHLILDKVISSNLIRDYEKKYNQLISIRRALGKLHVDPSAIEREKDFTQYQIAEIDNARLNPAEDNEVELKYKKAQNAKILQQNFENLVNILKEADDSAYVKLSTAIRELNRFRSLGYDDLLEHAQLALEEIGYLHDMLTNEMETFEIDEEELVRLEERLNLIQSLKRKYGSTVEEILEMKKELESKLKELQELENKKKELLNMEKELLEELENLGSQLDKERKKVAEKLYKEIKKHLHDLRMPSAALEFRFFPEPSPMVYGTSRVVLFVRTNPGADFMELGSVASGGELSRIILAIEAAVKDSLDLGTIVFDEIDAGVGARQGHILAEKLNEIAKSTQCVVITHLPQIAEKARKHFAVTKKTTDTFAYSNIVELTPEERKKEIKDMIGKLEVR
ncbi:hypothetical protein AT15_00735 [Kosmotoga arenicorallina S304]|uniref:DNA repair protein RecN n=1 Tax=Kosmotoga arenicorallina S304 TaxID=1453497 RepID=A0A176K0E4_9BACT|nr:AAA family ATPase [Kosmotoga arenicorallina]OAA30072.1 hypothetical protein AT15_00735 [Kosmotoga arenicorallina S304]